VVRVRLPRFEAWLLNHPELVRDVLVAGHHGFVKGPTMQAAKRVLGESLLTGEGAFHRQQRRLIQPIFHHDRLRGYAGVMIEHADRVSGGWEDGQSIDVHAEMARLTLSVVGKALFGTDVESEEARAIGVALTDSLALFGRVFSPLFPVMQRLPVPSIRRLGRAQRILDATIHRMIRERRAAAQPGSDLLSLLLAARDDGTGMSDQQVRDEAMTLFLAGHETTAVALTWTWYLLSEYPHVERRLHEELDHVLNGRLPAAADIPRLRYTGTILRESMRVLPPAWAIGRRTLGQHPIPGAIIPRGAVVVVSPYLVHHDERWWPQPEAFAPERWVGEEGIDRPRLAYFPFGAGPRMCVGEPFAWMESMLVLATIARRWRLRLAPGHRVGFQPSITLRPRNGMPMIAEARPPGPRVPSVRE
jgi:cytochrome P450